MASEGGFTVIPELDVDDNENDKTVVRAFDTSVPLRAVSMVYARSFSKERLLKILSEEIKNSVPKEMLDPGRGNVVEWK